MNYEILGGLKAALERGQSLKSSMNSFLNSGYNQAEIEEAARALAEPSHVEQKSSEIISASATPKIPEKTKKTKKQIFKKLFSEKKQTPVPVVVKAKSIEIKKEKIPEVKKIAAVQKISAYGEGKSEKLWIIVLLSALVFLALFLILILIFNKDIINFFSDIFNK